jgi:sarcosine oxidase gamma subunit
VPGSSDSSRHDDPGEFTVLVRRSFASYLADWLIDAAEEFRPV